MWLSRSRTGQSSHGVAASRAVTPATFPPAQSLARRYRSRRSRSIAHSLQAPGVHSRPYPATEGAAHRVDGVARWLVTGARGQLGADVVAQLTAAGEDVVAVGRAELDITDADAVRRTIADTQ